MINRDLALFVKNLMPEFENSKDPNKPVSIWKELDRLRGFPEKTVVCIFRTNGCAWYKFSSCSMCGYFNDVSSGIIDENLFKQIDILKSSLNGAKVLKIFTSGSFLDPREIPENVRDYFFESFKDSVDKILIESRTEFIKQETLDDIKRHKIPLRIAIGLESANDYIIKYSVNKGTNFNKFLSAAKLLRANNLELRTYLILKPPFISEKMAISDVISSVRAVAGYSNDVSINPMNIQKNTMVEALWKRGLYRPPRLFSLAESLLKSRDSGTEVLSYPTGGNRDRGVHNDEFDGKLLDLIVRSSLNQDFNELDEYYNSIDKSKYYMEIDLEDRMIFQSDYKKLVSHLSESVMFY
ncbi:archaeosine biosynthesis radical SAM protein RaSEA [Picrophilus oshimae]|uniref:Hypothetical archaea-specific FeS oxidoreductase n=1 Tax=Picrophilus torridus (strain ATCC 700027 / DSM 9790 / JCM 10055 / NBRC 100828 / KAW 2/3) TaxID=1122961 RepID=Q6L0T2_PICTO|nr:archaeosine biosynthesis radical SAM protein RaSEA [Picrophilus oshimae]AAT43420.1 hypothetical archaea-specific FeS oxidoreductase [Picrophilus oshimae DSM 9789]